MFTVIKRQKEKEVTSFVTQDYVTGTYGIINNDPNLQFTSPIGEKFSYKS